MEEQGDWSDFPQADVAIRNAAWAVSCNPNVVVTTISEASVVLGSDAMVRQLNLTYRGKDIRYQRSLVSIPATARRTLGRRGLSR